MGPSATHRRGRRWPSARRPRPVGGVDPEASAVRGRDGDTGPRQRGTIGYGVLRGGDVVGDHTVVFAGAGERLELGHRAHERAIFARGAVHAAAWAVRQPPGFYGMRDVLDLPK